MLHVLLTHLSEGKGANLFPAVIYGKLSLEQANRNSSPSKRQPEPKHRDKPIKLCFPLLSHAVIQTLQGSVIQ